MGQSTNGDNLSGGGDKFLFGQLNVSFSQSKSYCIRKVVIKIKKINVLTAYELECHLACDSNEI